METTDVSDAVESLIDAAKRNGKISHQTFSKVAREHIVSEKLLAHNFEKKTGSNWNNFQIAKGSNQKSLVLAIKIAKSRLEKSTNKYMKIYWKFCGDTFKVHNQSFVYVGMFKHSHLGDNVHEFMKVSSLETILAEWSTVHQDYPALANLVLSD